MNCPSCQQPLQGSPQELQGTLCPYCQTVVTVPLASTNPYARPTAEAPLTQVQHPGTLHEGDGTGGLIPYKNPKALAAYYLGIVSGLPLIGLPFGIAAFVFGIMGLKARKRKPVIKGSAHAWIGIGCGGLFTLLWSLLAIAIVVSLITKH